MMEMYTTLPEIKSHEIKYGAYPETDKTIILEKINAFCSDFFRIVSPNWFEHGNYFFLDVLPTANENMMDFLKDYIGYDFREEDFHTLDKTDFYQKLSETDELQKRLEQLFESDYLESCHVGNPSYCMPNTNLFYVLLDVYCIRYKNYTFVISYGNDE